MTVSLFNHLLLFQTPLSADNAPSVLESFPVLPRANLVSLKKELNDLAVRV